LAAFIDRNIMAGKGAMQCAAPLSASSPGLGSGDPALPAKKMDGRVKPGHDDGEVLRYTHHINAESCP
jgi:hypothetical protein